MRNIRLSSAFLGFLLALLFPALLFSDFSKLLDLLCSTLIYTILIYTILCYGHRNGIRNGHRYGTYKNRYKKTYKRLFDRLFFILAKSLISLGLPSCTHWLASMKTPSSFRL